MALRPDSHPDFQNGFEISRRSGAITPFSRARPLGVIEISQETVFIGLYAGDSSGSFGYTIAVD
jgi:hypothetical protein